MKKILAQEYFYKSASWWSGTLQSYREIYTVPAPDVSDDYSDTIYTECRMYIYPNIRGTKEDLEINYNIRIVKGDWSLVDPRTKIYSDPTDINSPLLQDISADQSQDEHWKWIITNRPTRNRQEFPVIYDNICLQTWDKIVVQALTPWITVQVFWEELQYDSDAQTLILRDKLEEIRNELELMRSIDPQENPLWAAILEHMERDKSVDPLENAFNAQLLEELSEMKDCMCEETPTP